MADEDINPVVLLADPKVNHRVCAEVYKYQSINGDYKEKT